MTAKDTISLKIPLGDWGAALSVFATKKPGQNIMRYFGDPAVSERPCGLSVPPLRMV
jgi:hypothetical protein